MPKCVIDGHEVEFTPGQNLIEVARKAGVEIPYFCYHPGLSIVAQCRMCAVEIEKMAKLQTACSTAATETLKERCTLSIILRIRRRFSPRLWQLSTRKSMRRVATVMGQDRHGGAAECAGSVRQSVRRMTSIRYASITSSVLTSS